MVATQMQCRLCICEKCFFTENLKAIATGKLALLWDIKFKMLRQEERDISCSENDTYCKQIVSNDDKYVSCFICSIFNYFRGIKSNSKAS